LSSKNSKDFLSPEKEAEEEPKRHKISKTTPILKNNSKESYTIE